jgi:hypothetical protein
LFDEEQTKGGLFQELIALSTRMFRLFQTISGVEAPAFFSDRSPAQRDL